jgi:mRNA interferase HigB
MVGLSMRVIAKSRLREFWEKHSDSEQALCAWYAEANSASWATPADIKAQYGSASVVADNRIVFNICGNKYRLVVKVHYPTGYMYIRFIGTHADYDKVDVTVV